MKKLGLMAAMAAVVAITLSTVAPQVSAQPTARFFDPVSRTWVDFGPGARYRGKSPVKKEVINYDGPYGANTIIVDTSERRLYYVIGNGKALKYGVGVGREGFQWSGTHRITRKAEWPGWTPPPAMRKRQPGLPSYMEGGPNNPLGARALYIGSTLYRIHGSNEPWTIGQAVSSGCIRMTNDDVTDLYERVNVGTKVVVRH
ncbi:L,D-transpeptidase [Afifella pfennigii]|uniref:L,D-transpeptidase n=1 Tax=Afifella pfennigii TaxID=209897 RepID=UPI000479A288|nr:L,D-transpeptidase [Afifella pfennigii]